MENKIQKWIRGPVTNLLYKLLFPNYPANSLKTPEVHKTDERIAKVNSVKRDYGVIRVSGIDEKGFEQEVTHDYADGDVLFEKGKTVEKLKNIYRIKIIPDKILSGDIVSILGENNFGTVFQIAHSMKNGYALEEKRLRDYN